MRGGPEHSIPSLKYSQFPIVANRDRSSRKRTPGLAASLFHFYFPFIFIGLSGSADVAFWPLKCRYADMSKISQTVTVGLTAGVLLARLLCIGLCHSSAIGYGTALLGLAQIVTGLLIWGS